MFAGFSLGGKQLKEVILTPEGYEKLKVEIATLSTERRREVADRIRVAREFGDIAENAEYDDAKNEQAMLEHKIAQLEERLSSARVINSRDDFECVIREFLDWRSTRGGGGSGAEAAEAPEELAAA